MSELTPSTIYNGMRVVAVPMEKGGVGKTTLSILLAAYAAEGYFPDIKKRVLVMDFDAQQNLSQSFLPMESIPNFKALLPPTHPDYDPNDPEDVEWGGRSNSVDLYYGNPVVPYPTKQSDNLDCLPSDGFQLLQFDQFKRNDDKTLLQQINEEMVNFFSEPDVQDLYDLVVLDCPPGVQLITSPILRAATDIIIPVAMEGFSVSGFHKLIREIDNEHKDRPFPLNIAGVIPNLYDTRKTVHKSHWKQLQAQKDHPRYGQAIVDQPVKNLADFITQRLPFNEKPQSLLPRSSLAYEITMSVMDHISHMMYGRGIDQEKAFPTKTSRKKLGTASKSRKEKVA